MPPRKGQLPSTPPVVMRRVKRKPVSTPVVEEKQTTPPHGQPEPPRKQPVPASSAKPVKVENPQASPPAPAQPSSSSPADVAARAEARQRRHEEALVLLEKIQARWPETYPKEAQAIRPMKTGIHRDVSAALPDIPKVRIRVENEGNGVRSLLLTTDFIFSTLPS